MRTAHARPVLIGDPGLALEPLRPGETFSEDWLQRLIHDHPGLLPVEEIEPGFGEPVALAREVQTKHGPIDNLLVTPEGNIVLVEVKLWRNPEARRKVVAQALDYASCLFGMGYESFEKAVLEAGPAREGVTRLHDLVRERPDALDEAAFVDAVSANLARGRALILVVGDGIRSETERLASLLQSHAGAHFTFALIELALYRLGDHTLVLPRTLARTQMIPRGIITIDDRRVEVVAAPEAGSSPAPARQAATITEEQFYEAMAAIRPDLPGALRALIARLEPLGVHADVRGSLILRWDPPEGRSINLGYIAKNGQLWTDAINAANVPQDLAHAYLEDLADALGATVAHPPNGRRYLLIGGHGPRIAGLTGKLDKWPPVIERFIAAMTERIRAED